MIQPARRLQHTEEYYFSKKLREIDQMNGKGVPVINLGIGSPDMAPSPRVIEQLSATAARPGSHGYQGYKGIPALRNALAGFYRQWYQVELDPETEILPLLGSKEGILHISMTFLNEGDRALVPDPGYPTYRAATRLAGGTCLVYSLESSRGWLPDLEMLERQDLENVKLMWVNYPNMPTGARAGLRDFEKLVAFARSHRILLCHDNPYSFILNENPVSMLSVAGAMDTAIELNSLSKSHNMAGWRVGMLAGRQEIISEVLRFKSNMDSGMFLPVQEAAVTALGLGKDWFKKLNDVYRRRRDKVFELLDLFACSYEKDQSGLFIWAAVPDQYADGYAMSDSFLYDGRVFITPGGIFGDNGNKYVRISLCRDVKVLEEAIGRVAKIKTKQPV
jgi:LL-diaminopimelate aminotransferase